MRYKLPIKNAFDVWPSDRIWIDHPWIIENCHIHVFDAELNQTKKHQQQQMYSFKVSRPFHESITRSRL